MVLSQDTLDEILDYLEKSIQNLAMNTLESLEFQEGFKGVEDFLNSQFDIRLENLLSAKNSSVHHLESKMKNKVIQRKSKIFEDIEKKFKN